ncbi:MAG: CDGSH iron-sulfur domain-containing protein [Bacteroidetes bacterium]|nr:CDGSH iron-sulfur domain-containing protein [Bacteroidota bacterium]
MNQSASPLEKPEVEAIKVKITGGGPILVRGEVKIIHKDGREELRKNVALCRCGQSASKPFCDGAHHKIEFDK